MIFFFFFFSSRRRHTRSLRDWSSDVCSSDLLGMPFSDPMADGPAIQASSQRALKAGQTMKKTLAMVRDFRAGDNVIPMVLMGYYNPIYVYPNRFIEDV